MTENKRRFKTIIAGKTYTIVGNKAPEHLNAVAELVNAQLEQIKVAAPALGREERGILVAVNAISDLITKQLELEELQLKVAELEKALQEKQSAAEAAPVEETAQGEPEKASDVETQSEATTTETPVKAEAAEKPGENATEKKAVANLTGKKRDSESQTVTSMPATISELQQAAREANELPARKSNSKLSKTTTSSEAALKRAQHRNQVRSALGVNRNAENAIPPYTNNKEHDGKK